MHSTLGVSGTGTRLDLIEWLCWSIEMFLRHEHCMVTVIATTERRGKWKAS